MPHTTATVASSSGLHARPASLFVEAAQRYDAAITIGVGENPAVDAKSILFVMSLGAGHGTEVRIAAEGTDANAALTELTRLIETNLDDQTRD